MSHLKTTHTHTDFLTAHTFHGYLNLLHWGEHLTSSLSFYGRAGRYIRPHYKRVIKPPGLSETPRSLRRMLSTLKGDTHKWDTQNWGKSKNGIKEGQNWRLAEGRKDNLILNIMKHNLLRYSHSNNQNVMQLYLCARECVCMYMCWMDVLGRFIPLRLYNQHSCLSAMKTKRRNISLLPLTNSSQF